MLGSASLHPTYIGDVSGNQVFASQSVLLRRILSDRKSANRFRLGITRSPLSWEHPRKNTDQLLLSIFFDAKLSDENLVRVWV